VINASGHSSAVDWWELGIFLFELVYGVTPFRGSFREQTFENVLHKELSFPADPPVSQPFLDIVRALLIRDSAQRLGTRGGAEEVKAHAFFAEIEFHLIRSLAAPIVPGVPGMRAKTLPGEELFFVMDGV